MSASNVFSLHKENVYVLPVTHYNMEMAAQVRMAFASIKPDCIAVELPETMQEKFLHAASRLPDISVVLASKEGKDPSYYMCEPCDPAFEGLRCAIENSLPGFCIDLDVDKYPDIFDPIPDPYAIQRIGLKLYYTAYHKTVSSKESGKTDLDWNRELYMAKRLKELSLSHETVLFIAGMSHVENVLRLVDRASFPELKHCRREKAELCTLSEDSCRDVMNECAWISKSYELLRERYAEEEDALLFSGEGALSSFFPPDRQKLLYRLYVEAGKEYEKNTGSEFCAYHLKNTMKFVRNYSLIRGKLMPDLFLTVSSAKCCVDHNYAYEVWRLATDYPFYKNVDNLPKLELSVKDVWGHSKTISFHMKEKNRKHFLKQERRRKNKQCFHFDPPDPFSLCSYPPEDLIIENFGDFIRKKGRRILLEESVRTVPFTTSIEDGIDIKETIRNWHVGKLYVKTHGRPPENAGSIVLIFDEDDAEEKGKCTEKFPWLMTWLGEHQQESDMAFYASGMGENIVGPGICRCEYGGFMMTYPPRRMLNIWNDPDYASCRSKSETLLMAAVDYALQPVIVYVAAKPPRSIMRSFSKRFGKRIVYVPIGQMSSILINKIRVFHVLENHNKREIADEYIF